MGMKSCISRAVGAFVCFLKCLVEQQCRAVKIGLFLCALWVWLLTEKARGLCESVLVHFCTRLLCVWSPTLCKWCLWPHEPLVLPQTSFSSGTATAPQCQCGGHQLHVLVELHLPNPKRIRITGEALHVWDIQVQLEQHCAKKEHESFYLPLSKLTSSWSCLPLMAKQCLVFNFSIISNLWGELQMWIPKFPNFWGFQMHVQIQSGSN